MSHTCAHMHACSLLPNMYTHAHTHTLFKINKSDWILQNPFFYLLPSLCGKPQSLSPSKPLWLRKVAWSVEQETWALELRLAGVSIFYVLAMWPWARSLNRYSLGKSVLRVGLGKSLHLHPVPGASLDCSTSGTVIAGLGSSPFPLLSNDSI